MKRILFIRHGKSSWKHNVNDINRPLKKRAIEDASLIAQHIKDLNIEIDAVYSSPAKRAFTTCKLIVNQLAFEDDKVEVHDLLYDFAGQNVITFIQNINPLINTVVLFGHNHAFTALINTLGDKYLDNLPTTGLAIIKFDTDSWRDLKHGKTELIIFPKQLKNT